MGRVDEVVARDAVGMEVYVFIDEIIRLLSGWARDVVGMQPFVTKGEIGRLIGTGSRDELGKSSRSP
jgi:hypothetical protein